MTATTAGSASGGSDAVHVEVVEQAEIVTAAVSRRIVLRMPKNRPPYPFCVSYALWSYPGLLYEGVLNSKV
jgi:hypothetical protein